MTFAGPEFLFGALELGSSSVTIDKATGRMVPDLLVVLGSGLLLLLILLIWAVYIRKPKRSHSSHSRSPRKVDSEADANDGQGNRRRRKRRVRRREHRSRNPTLAQTGGLPTTRNEQSGTQPFTDATQ